MYKKTSEVNLTGSFHISLEVWMTKSARTPHPKIEA